LFGKVNPWQRAPKLLDCCVPDVGVGVSDQNSRSHRPNSVHETIPALVFQPSDPEPDARLSIAAWVKAARVTNVRAPVALDASHSVWPIASADGIICINMVHISPWEATVGLIKGAAAILPPA
jgi:hypothetical protein